MNVNYNYYGHYSLTLNAVTLGAIQNSELKYIVEVQPHISGVATSAKLTIVVTWKNSFLSTYRLPTFNLEETKGKTLQIGEYFFGVVIDIAPVYTQPNGNLVCKSLVFAKHNFLSSGIYCKIKCKIPQK